jgi:hypothetical protein
MPRSSCFPARYCSTSAANCKRVLLKSWKVASNQRDPADIGAEESGATGSCAYGKRSCRLGIDRSLTAHRGEYWLVRL